MKFENNLNYQTSHLSQAFHINNKFVIYVYEDNFSQKVKYVKYFKNQF